MMGVRDITLLYMNPASWPPELVNFSVRNMQAESCLMPLMRRGGESARAFEGQIQREREREKERQKDRGERQRERARARERKRERQSKAANESYHLPRRLVLEKPQLLPPQPDFIDTLMPKEIADQLGGAGRHNDWEEEVHVRRALVHRLVY
jgi:hypothetical protein